MSWLAFFKSYDFHWLFGLALPICLMIICVPIPIVFFPSFPTWGFHSHLVRVRYMTGGPIGRSIICFGSLSCFLFYSNNPPYLCFPFFSELYTYSRFYIKCGSYIFTIAKGVINNRFFSVTNKVRSLVSLGVGPFYITSSWLFYSQLGFFIFWVH
jgi:hypothetical protein